MLLSSVSSPAEEGGYIALNSETGTTSQGDTVNEAAANLKEAKKDALWRITKKSTLER